MIGNPSVLHHTAPYPFHDSVQLGNGEQLAISHTGNTTLTIGKSDFKLDNVYLIPSMRKNLLSISQFCIDKNVLCSFDSNNFYIFDLKSYSLLFQGRCRDGLYR